MTSIATSTTYDDLLALVTDASARADERAKEQAVARVGELDDVGLYERARLQLGRKARSRAAAVRAVEDSLLFTYEMLLGGPG